MLPWHEWFEQAWAAAAVTPMGRAVPIVRQVVPWLEPADATRRSAVVAEWPADLAWLGHALAPTAEPEPESEPEPAAAFTAAAGSGFAWTLRVTRGIDPQLAESAPFGLDDRNALGALPRARRFGYRLRWDPAHRQLSMMHPESRRGLWIVDEPLPTWDAAAPLRRLLQWVGAEEDVMLTHAGTVVHDGRALLLVGAGEAGKSSTVGIAVRSGMKTVGEDYVLLSRGRPGSSGHGGPHEAAPFVAPLYATLKLRSGSPLYASRTRDFGPDLDAASEPERACVRFANDRLSEAVSVAGLVVMDPGAAPEARPVERSIGLRHLSHSTLLQADDDHAWALRTLRALAAELPCWRLGHCDPQRLPQILAELLP